MKLLLNTEMYRDQMRSALHAVPWPSDDADTPASLLARCPVAAETPLVSADILAKRASIGQVSVKDERGRMGLGSFKALGAAYVIASDAAAGRARGQTYVTASAGNHGLSVAAGASAFGAKAVIYLASSVPKSFADRLRDLGAQVLRHGDIYEDSMSGAAAAADAHDWVLLSDSSWQGYIDRPRVLMEGYLVLMQEAAAQIAAPPTHIFLQAGVGGLAVACATYARKTWGAAPKIIAVEPDAAPAIYASIIAGSPQITTGPVSSMGRLDCKEPSLIALKGLARDADAFVTISEEEGGAGHQACIDAGLPSTASGAAGLAALLAAKDHRETLGLTKTSHALIILSEEHCA